MLFIVGRGRSGTTLLYEILKRHDDIYITREGKFLISLKHKYFYAKFTDEILDSFVSDAFLEDNMQNWGLKIGEMKRKIKGSNPKPSSFGEACLFICRAAAESAEKQTVKVIVNKDPHYSLFIPSIKEIFPDAKFIWITRDYRDNILSYKNVWFDLGNTAALAYRWLLFNKKISKTLKSISPSSYIHISYEELIQDPQKVIKEIYALLGVDYNKEHLSYTPEKKERQDWHSKVSSPLDQNNIGKWKEQLTTEDIKIAERICSTLGNYLGYPHSQSISQGVSFKCFYGCIQANLYTYLETFFIAFPFQYKFKISNKIRRFFQSRKTIK